MLSTETSFDDKGIIATESCLLFSIYAFISGSYYILYSVFTQGLIFFIASESRPGRKIRVFYNKAVRVTGDIAHIWVRCRLELKFTSSRAFQKTTIKFVNPYLLLIF